MPDSPWPRLSDLPGPRHPERCQGCGSAEKLSRWQEHGEADRPEPILVVLCHRCADRLVEPHPRLYRRLGRNEPYPGVLDLCVQCVHRDGVRCRMAKAQGGQGLHLTIKKPAVVHVQRSPRRLSGWVRMWLEPASACSARQESPAVQETPGA